MVRLALACLVCATPASAQLWEECNVLRTHLGENFGDGFGWVSVNGGDVDGDGADDVLVGAWNFSDTGKAYVYSGASGGLIFEFAGVPGEDTGFAVASGGDLDGNGLGEVIVGAPAGASPGRAYVLAGASGGVLWTLTAGVPGDRFGSAVACAGDVDGDLVDDYLVGAPGDNTVGPNAGRAYVLCGATGTVVRTHDGEAAGDRFGSAAGRIGDLDGDQQAEYIVAAHNGGVAARGRAYVYDGATGALLQTLDPAGTGGSYGQFFAGHCGDVDADGMPDFFVSDRTDSANGAGAGRAYVYSGADFSVLHDILGENAGDGFGTGRGWAGDVDGDGHDDLFWSGWTANDGGNSAGEGIVFSGDTGRVLAEFHGDTGGVLLGYDAAGLGDVDGDGAPDFVLSSAIGVGLVHVVTGSPAPPRAFCTALPNSTGAAAELIYRRSTSLVRNEFRLRLRAAPPGEAALFFYGPERAAAPLGDGLRCVGGELFRAGPPVTLNASGAVFQQLDFDAPPFDAGPGAVVAGTTWFFQGWHRDTAGVNGSNLSNGLAVIFCP